MLTKFTWQTTKNAGNLPCAGKQEVLKMKRAPVEKINQGISTLKKQQRLGGEDSKVRVGSWRISEFKEFGF